MKLNEKAKAILIVASIVTILVGAVVAYAVYTMTSNTVPIDVTAQATLTLATSSGSIVYGSTVTLTATCSDSSFSGVVAFTANGISIGSASASEGVATLVWTPSQSGSYSVIATASHN